MASGFLSNSLRDDKLNGASGRPDDLLFKDVPLYTELKSASQ